MNKTIYKQLNTKWSSKPYPTKNSTFGANGCGCCACVHVAIEQESKKNWTPETLRPYMVKQGYAVSGQGTRWNGITETLKYLGHKNVVRIWDDPMSEAWKELNKGNRIGVLLLDSTRGPDGTKWTASGHYIAFTDYKVANGQHWFYCKDSGGRNHDGWYCYEKSMRGALPKIWIVERIGKAPTPPKPTPEPTPKKGSYTGAYPNPKKYLEKGDKGTEVTKLQKYLNWAFGGQAGYTKIAEDGIFGNATHKWSVLWQTKAMGAGQGDGKVGLKTIAKMKEYGGYKPSPSPSKDIKVVDISAYQDNINWTKAKNAGVKGAIIKCGYRGGGSGKLYTDGMFLNHIKSAYKAGVPVGIYFFTEAINAKEGKEEADYAIKLWKTAGVPLSFPIAIDTEDMFYTENGKRYAGRANSSKLSKAKRTEAIKAFCEQIKAKGYNPMIYASLSWLNNQLDMSKLPYNVWIAQYNSTCDYKGKYVMWQYTSSGKIDGIKGDVDVNHCYIDPKPYNPTPTPAPTPTGYTGKFPSYRLTKTNAKVISDACKWAKWIADGIDFHYGCNDHAFHNGCYFCGTQYMKKGHGIKMWETTYCCNPFVGAAWAHGGGDAQAYKMCHNCNSWDFTLKNGSYEKSSLFDKLGKPSKSKLKAGDVLCNWTHVALYIGDGKIAEASGLDDNVYGSKKWKNSIAVKTLTDAKYKTFERCYRYNGKVDADRPLMNGEVSDRVADMQRFLIWYGATNISVNGIFDARTLKAVIAFQEKEMGKGQGDGAVGPKTINAMKAVKK